MRRRGCHWLAVALVGLVIAGGCGDDGTGTAGPPTRDAGGPPGGDNPAPAKEGPPPPSPR